jgi:hypothetical protein
MTTETVTRNRRKYTLGRCEDCGHTTSTTIAYWWASDFKMRLCADCIKPYRPQLLSPCSARCIHNEHH